ncbi:MAG: hypothetical protein HKL80_07465 [Acidimicrobiales bacterium]|nr:hypothetical protein [Acidimicrobiales bacterium]
MPDDIAENIAFEAEKRGMSSEDVVAQLLRSHLPDTDTTELGFIGIGHSGRNDLSEKVKEIRRVNFTSW